MALNLPFGTKDTDRKDAKPKPINQFVSQIKTGGLARTNRFAVMFSPPPGMDTGGLQKLLLFCDTVQLPGINYSTTQNRSFGEFREVPYEKLYDPISMSFHVDTDMKVKALFDDWMSLISDPQTRTFNYYKYYTTDIKIEVQDINDKTRYELTLKECYPKNMNSISLDHSSKDSMKLTVNMQYKYWTASPMTQLADGETVPLSLIDKLTKNFTGFQETLNRAIGTTAGNFVTGSVLSYGVTKLPGLLKF